MQFENDIFHLIKSSRGLDIINSNFHRFIKRFATNRALQYDPNSHIILGIHMVFITRFLYCDSLSWIAEEPASHRILGIHMASISDSSHNSKAQALDILQQYSATYYHKHSTKNLLWYTLYFHSFTVLSWLADAIMPVTGDWASASIKPSWADIVMFFFSCIDHNSIDCQVNMKIHQMWAKLWKCVHQLTCISSNKIIYINQQ